MIDSTDNSLTSAVDPLILEIYLYNNNYKDRLLITELMEKAQTVKIPGLDDTSFFVKTDDMWEILNTKFRKDIRDFDSTPYDTLNASITSIYFVYSMIQSFSKLKYFRINVSDSQIYTRKVNDSIQFGYRIVHSKIDLPSVCTPEFLFECKRIFKKLGFYTPDPFDRSPYFEVSIRDLFGKIREYMQQIEEIDPEGEELNILLNIQMLFGTKLEKDNSVVLVIVEV